MFSYFCRLAQISLAFLLIALAIDVLGASPIKAGWKADGIASFSNESVSLLDKEKQVAAVVSKSRINRLLDTLSRIQNAAGITSELWIVQLTDAKPNAFATSKDGTNYVLISLSMLDLLGDDMDAYAALFGHELAHHVKEHGAQSQKRKGFLQGLSFIASMVIGAKTGVNVGSLTDLGANLIDRTYSRDQEREADQLGLSYMVTAGFNPQGAITLQRRMLAASGSTLFPFLSTHPGGEERLANLEKMIASLPSSSTARTQTDSTTKAPKPSTVASLAREIDPKSSDPLTAPTGRITTGKITPNIEVVYYDVLAKSADELSQQLNNQGPVGENGRRFHGYTKWNIQWRYWYKNVGGACGIERVQVSVQVTHTFPNWVNESEAPSEYVTKWRDYLAALKRYHHRYQEHGMSAADEIDQAIVSLKPQANCAELGRVANEVAHGIVRKYNAKDRELWRTTNYGATLGVVFPRQEMAADSNER